MVKHVPISVIVPVAGWYMQACWVEVSIGKTRADGWFEAWVGEDRYHPVRVIASRLCLTVRGHRADCANTAPTATGAHALNISNTLCD